MLPAVTNGYEEQINWLPEEHQSLERFREFRRTQSAELRDRLVLEHAPLVYKLARQFTTSGESIEDLVQEGTIGLIKAVDRFDPDKDVKFVTYATHVISGEIRHYIRDSGKLIQEPSWHQQLRYQIARANAILQQQLGRPVTPDEIACALGVDAGRVKFVLQNIQTFRVGSLDARMEEDEDGSGEMRLDHTPEVEPDMIEQVENRLVLRQAIAQLGRLQRAVVFYFFYQGLSKTEIARQLGISINYAAYLVKRAVHNMRRTLEASTAAEPEVERRLAAFERRAEQVETVDVETCLLTATSFHRQLRAEVVRARRYPQEFAAALFEVVGWERIIPRLSRRAVEVALRQFVQTLRHNCRETDALFRYDAHRFAAILPHTGASGKVLCERVVSTVRQDSLRCEGKQPLPKLSVTYRLAVYPADGATSKALLQTLLAEGDKG